MLIPRSSKFFTFFFFFNDTATTEIYTLSLHDALPICPDQLDEAEASCDCHRPVPCNTTDPWLRRDRKSTRLNSSHVEISYAVFCLKKKKKKQKKKKNNIQEIPKQVIRNTYSSISSCMK